MANNIFDLLNGIWGDTPPAPPALQDLNYNLSNIRFDQFPTINTDSTFRVNALPDIKTISSLSLSIDKLAPVSINAAVTQLPDMNLNLGTTVDIKRIPKLVMEAGLNDLRIKELAPINLQFSLKPARLKLPFGYSIKVGFLGLEMFSFSMKGELKAELDDP